MNAQRARVNLAPITPSAGVANVKTFETDMPRGLPISRIIQRISFNLISTGGAFSLAVDTAGSAAAEGTDDLDVLLNALFALWYFEWSAGNPVGSAMTPAQWRTIFGCLNRRDFEGSFTNGASVPISSGSAKSFYVDIAFPVSLAFMFRGGGLTTRGTDSMRSATWQYTAGASVTPSVVLTNGTAAVSGLVISQVLFGGNGLGSDVGASWNITRRSIDLPYNFPQALRLAMIDTTPESSYNGAAISIWDYVNAAAKDFTTAFQQDILGVAGGAYDFSARGLPYYVLGPDDGLEALAARYGQPTTLQVASGFTSTTVYDLILQEPHAPTVAHVGQQVSPGANVAISRVLPNNSGPIPPELEHFLPVRVQPAAAAGLSATIHVNPQTAASAVAKTNTIAAGVQASLASLFGRR